MPAPLLLRTLGTMAKTPTVDQAVERARRAQADRIEVVRALATARQALTDEHAAAAERIAAVAHDNAERARAFDLEDVRAYQAALRAGWTRDELRRIGFDEPPKIRRARRKKASSAPTSPGAGVTNADDGDDTSSRPSAG